MALKEKKIHMLFELLAIVLLVPFFIRLLFKYKFDMVDKYFLIIVIITTIVVDGYLFFSWFKKTKYCFDNEDILKN